MRDAVIVVIVVVGTELVCFPAGKAPAFSTIRQMFYGKPSHHLEPYSELNQFLLTLDET